MKEGELWVCVKTKACGWTGAWKELVQVPHRKLKHSTEGRCPKCFGRIFYVRDNKDANTN